MPASAPTTAVSIQPASNANGVNTVPATTDPTQPQPSGALGYLAGGPAATPPSATTIDSTTLAPATPTPFNTPAPTPIPDISNLQTTPSNATAAGSSPYYNPTTDTLTATPGETAASKLDSQTEALNTEDANKAADTTAAQNAAGIPALTQQQQDLSAQVTSLKDEAAAIPNQLQLDATGRGITANGLTPVQTAALRNNSIQALTVSALLDATNGLIASANTKVTNAIAAKYGPIEASIKANTANLDLILKDPSTTTDEANRAEAQKQNLAAQAEQVAQQKQDATDVLNATTKAAANGADAVTLQKMQAAKTGEEATSIAAAAGYGTNPLTDESTRLDIETKQQALATAAAESSPEAISGAVNSLTTFNGSPFYTTTDLTGMDAKTKQAFQTAAMAAGAKPLSPKDGDAITAINESQANLAAIQQFIQGGQSGQSILPSGFLGQPGQYANTKLQDFLQTNSQLASYQSWMASIPSLLGALKGSSSGSGGSSRLFGTISSLLPAMTDTLPVALQKLQNVNTILTNGGNSIMGISNSGGGTYSGVTLPGTGTSSSPSTGSSSGSTFNGVTLPN